MFEAGRNVPPAVIREIGGGGGFETRIEVGGGAAMSGDESSISRAPLTSSTSGVTGRLEVAGFTAGVGSRDSGLGGEGSPAPFPSVVSRLAGVANFGSLSWLTDGPKPG
jgi:hypothetical protein